MDSFAAALAGRLSVADAERLVVLVCFALPGAVSFVDEFGREIAEKGSIFLGQLQEGYKQGLG